MKGRPQCKKNRKRGKDHPQYGTPISEEIRSKISSSLKGDKNPRAQLTWEQVREVRNLYNTGQYLQRELAEKFHVSRGCMTHILTNRTWRE